MLDFISTGKHFKKETQLQSVFQSHRIMDIVVCQSCSAISQVLLFAALHGFVILTHCKLLFKCVSVVCAKKRANQVSRER